MVKDFVVENTASEADDARDRGLANTTSAWVEFFCARKYLIMR